MNTELLKKLKEQLSEMCGLISIDEIISNEPLIRVIERFDRMLKEAIA